MARHARRARLDRAGVAPGRRRLRHGGNRRRSGRARRQAVAPGPSGAPSRGRPEVLPTGRNFYSVDTRAVPTPAAWQLGWHSAGLLVERYAQEHGSYPARLALSAWGTANMRTGGDDIAQALALIGVRPVWEGASGRVTGFEILPASVLDRPRVDVTLAHLRVFPRRLSRADRSVRQRGARRRRARRAARDQPARGACRRRRRARSKLRASRRTRRRCAPATGSSAPSRAPMAPACRP